MYSLKRKPNKESRPSMGLQLITLIILLAIGSPVIINAQNNGSLTPMQMRQDLEYLRDVWIPLDKSFSPPERLAFDSIVSGAIANTKHLTPAQFTMEVARAVAVSRNGHTSAGEGNVNYFHSLPFYPYWFADGLYIISTHPDFSNLLGARIEKIGTLTAEEALAGVSPFISGTDAFIKILSPFYLSNIDLLHYIGATKDPKKVKLTVRLQNEKTHTVVLGATTSAMPRDSSQGFQPYRLLLPGNLNTPGHWPHVLDTISMRPAIYQQPIDLTYEWIRDNKKTLYIRSNQIFNNGDGIVTPRIPNQIPLNEKLLNLLQGEVVKHKPKYVIIDMRLNLGGNFFNTIIFSQSLPKLIPPDGKIFVLVGPNTFSAAIVTAAMLKGYSNEQVMIVGETMGDDNPFWADGQTSYLPNSKIMLRSSNSKQDWSMGCNDSEYCDWANKVFLARPVSLEPELKIAPTFAEYTAGKDTVLDTVLKMAK